MKVLLTGAAGQLGQLLAVAQTQQSLAPAATGRLSRRP